MTAEKSFEKLCKIQDAINELNQEINAQVNHGDTIIACNAEEFADYFDKLFYTVHYKYENFKKDLLK